MDYMPAPEERKFNLPAQEEKILEFWEKNKIFEKSILQRKGSRRFVFYDGPPFATGLPHYGHILASTIKDVVPRYWTMRGFLVDRRWGWDCHGLPIEHLVEQELKISGRKAIEKFGIKKFNETARSKVLTYAKEWHKTVRRIGRFVDFENSYKTMDVTYMESVWWAFAELYKKGLVYKDSRTSLFCPRCETPLSNFEIAMDNSYRDQEDDSVYVKLPLKNSKNEFLLVWTTTPWTLPGNAAVAVNPKIEYTKYKVKHPASAKALAGKQNSKSKIQKYEYVWSATLPHEADGNISIVEKCSGKSLIGLKYEPPFRLSKDPSVYRVVGADFVDIEEGTGLVHIAPAFGEEDFVVGKKESLPIFETLDAAGRFKSDLSGLAFLGGMGTVEANPVIIEKLKSAGRLFMVRRITHRYPICWRCQTPLLFKVQPAWFIKISAIRKKMLKLNEKIDWHPAHLKHGRFGNDLETAPDWNVSRSRFWGTPIPIWECTKCNKVLVVGSRDELSRKSGGAKNKYFIMRHGEALSNLKNIVSYKPGGSLNETFRGFVQDERAARRLKNKKIDLIFSSDVLRTKQTAEIVGRALGVKKINFDKRLRELNSGVFEGKSPDEYHKYFSSTIEKFTKSPPRGETLTDVRKRVLAFVRDLEKKYSGRNILIVGHEYPLWILYGAAMGLSDEETVALRKGRREKEFIKFAEVMGLNYRNVPRNERGEGDLHLPHVNRVKVFCECGSEAKRVPDVFDCWVESGSMPFASVHYPFASYEAWPRKNLMRPGLQKFPFPADFISEYIAQTRGWFSRLHVLSIALFSRSAFKHVVTTGTILSEKGEKLSKSRKNFPDPWLLLGRYGADAMRYYLMASPVMLGDNINFSEKDVDEVYKKYSLIAYNVLNFFHLYKYKLKVPPQKNKSAHILDRWILSRLHTTIREVTRGFDSYEVVLAVRPLLGFVQDLSLWYVRRSRGRVKSDSPDAAAALWTLHNVLFDFSRLIAPVTPFLAEIIYQDLRKKKASVHLEDWPKADRRFMNKDLEEKMALVREIVSEALRKRAEAGIKVRQPLRELRIKNQELRKKRELLELIKDEVNIKEITFGDELKLDTTLTPELREEGLVREFVRNIQEMRRDMGLKPKQVVVIQVSGDRSIETILEKWAKTVKSETNSKEFKVGGKKTFRAERELELDGKELWVGVS